MTLTRAEIEELAGPLDNQLMAEIAAIDATAADLARALAWLEADEALINDGNHLPTGKVAELISILETVDDDEGYFVPDSSAAENLT
ncbi:MAG TPA: hypothetical protein VNS12_01165 [Pelagibacterium sp.]|uniref:hypothetical protein n=1 Tax=Pelagibacterium sp. TaxID=1967288 RepID=UPI002B8EC068|nr:hypothetical protein [Pelagibacterium sp.]HWJ86664.1 hypothetical protein [Pelagibacterium sp.]